MTDEFMAAVTVGPDDHLVLVPRHSLTPEQAERIKKQVPEALKGRVVVVSEMDVYVVEPEIGILPCGCVPPCEGHHEDEP